jgi:hypothetical protein
MNQAFVQMQRVTLPGRRTLQPLGIALAIAVPAFFLAWHDQARILVMLLTTASFILLWHVQRNLAVCLNFAYLVMLGDIRRLVSMVAPISGLDPLLMVGPLFTLYVGLPLLPKVKARDPLSRVMLVLLCVMLVEIVNPRQGGLLVGISAGLFWIVPLMWFWIGRAYSTDRMCELLLYRVICPLGVLDAFLGLYQTFVGFFPWEEAWIKDAAASGYNLIIGGIPRAFGFSTNVVEFTLSMLVSVVLLGAAFAAKRRSYILLLPPVVVSIFFASSRGAILRAVFGLAMVWAVRGYARNRATLLPRLLFALALGLGALGFGATQAADSGPSDPQARGSAAGEHVIQGLAHPTDAKSSTAGVHSAMFVDGILQGFTNPIGSGLGFVTLGAGKFGGTGGSTEVDISDSFVAMGLVGGICFVLMIYHTCRYTLEFFLYGRPLLTFALVGMFAALLGSWIGQGQYALAPTMCFCIGFVTRKHIQRQAEMDAEAKAAEQAAAAEEAHLTAQMA